MFNSCKITLKKLQNDSRIPAVRPGIFILREDTGQARCVASRELRFFFPVWSRLRLGVFVDLVTDLSCEFVVFGFDRDSELLVQ